MEDGKELIVKVTPEGQWVTPGHVWSPAMSIFTMSIIIAQHLGVSQRKGFKFRISLVEENRPRGRRGLINKEKEV